MLSSSVHGDIAELTMLRLVLCRLFHIILENRGKLAHMQQMRQSMIMSVHRKNETKKK